MHTQKKKEEKGSNFFKADYCIFILESDPAIRILDSVHKKVYCYICEMK